MAAPAPEPTSAPRRRVLVEIALTYAAVTAIAALLYRIPALRNYYSAIVAGLLLYAPALVARDRSFATFGVTFRPLGRLLATYAITVAVVFPLFLLGFVAFQKLACDVHGLRPLAAIVCYRDSPLLHFRPRLPPGFLELALGELVVIALPEELFFRGYVQTRLVDLWGAGWKPIAVASALFALCHLAVQWNPATLAVFFPGLLFGYLRARTGSLLPGVLFHASCNLYMEVLQRSFW